MGVNLREVGSEVPRHSPAFGGRTGRVVRHHPARLPVPGEHHVGGRRAPAREAPTPARPARSGRSPARRRRPGPPPGTAAPPSSARAARRGPSAPGSRRPAGSGSRGRRRPSRTGRPSSRPPVRLAPADGDQHPVAVGRVGDVGPAEGENPGGAFPGRARLPGEAGPEARPGHRRRGACRGAPQVVELGEVGGEGRVLEPPAVEPGVEARSTPGGCSGRGPTRNFHRKNARAGG